MPFSSGVTIPVSILLIPFGIFLIFYIFYSIFNVYHLLRFGVYGFGLYIISFLFVLGTLGMVGTSTYLLLKYDWSTPIQVDQFLEIDKDVFPGL